MKTLFKLILFFLPIFSIGQTKTQGPVKIGHEQLAKAELITDLIKDIPVDCKVTAYVFELKSGDKKIKYVCAGNELRIDIQNAFKKAMKGDSFSFGKLETACLEKHQKKYSFVITD